jgi:hypothetical protein
MLKKGDVVTVKSKTHKHFGKEAVVLYVTPMSARIRLLHEQLAFQDRFVYTSGKVSAVKNKQIDFITRQTSLHATGKKMRVEPNNWQAETCALIERYAGKTRRQMWAVKK